MDRDGDRHQDAVNSFVDLALHDSDNDSQMATSVSGFAAEEQRRMENGKRSLTEMSHADDDLTGIFHRTEPVNLTTGPDDKNSNKNVEGPADRSAGTRRSQYHSIQQLSQSGRPADKCGFFPSVEATVYGQAWLGCGRYPVDVAGEGEEDTLHVLRSLLRRYDSCAERGMAAEVFDGRGNESDEVASGRASNSDLQGDSQSEDDFEEHQSHLGQQVTLKRSPSTKILQAKRARVEHIVSNIRTPTYTEDAGAMDPGGSGGSTSVEVTTGDGGRRSKRKQTVPQQHDSATFDNEDHHTVNGNLSDDGGDDDDDDDNDDDNDDDDDDENRAVLSREQPDDDERELRQQLRQVQLRLEDMYTKYSKSLPADDVHLSTSRSPDDDNYLSSDSKVNDEAERLTSLLKAEFRHVVDGLVDRLIQQFLSKHFANRHRAPQNSPSTEDRSRLDFPRLSPAASLPVFPPLFSPLPFPVSGGDMLALRRAYAERCAYVDALVQQARTTRATDQDDGTLNYNNSTSGPAPCTAVTSPSTDTIDRCSLMSVNSSRCLLSDHQQFLPPQTQVPHVSRLIFEIILIHSNIYFSKIPFHIAI